MKLASKYTNPNGATFVPDALVDTDVVVGVITDARGTRRHAAPREEFVRGWWASDEVRQQLADAKELESTPIVRPAAKIEDDLPVQPAKPPGEKKAKK